MNKSIYEEVLEIIERRTKIGTMSSDYGHIVDDVLHIDNAYELTKLEQALKQAQKQEKLLELYRELITVKDELISLAWFDDKCDETEKIETDLEKRIKENENEIK